MTEKEMKKLSRVDLLSLLLEERTENESLRVEVETLKEQLASRMVTVKEAGSLAEVCAQLNGLFDTAQATAAQYLENIQTQSANRSKFARECERKPRWPASSWRLKRKNDVRRWSKKPQKLAAR